jgi:hypothetical protein
MRLKAVAGLKPEKGKRIGERLIKPAYVLLRRLKKRLRLCFWIKPKHEKLNKSMKNGRGTQWRPPNEKLFSEAA